MKTLYTITGCFKCGQVKNRLKDKGIEFEEIVCNSEQLEELIKRSNSLSLPILFDGDEELDVKEYLE